MDKSDISRRKFVGTAALGTGFLALTSTSQLFASGPTEYAPVLKRVWEQANKYLMEFAQAMPDDKYGFKPTDEVFSFAEQLLHLAGSNYWFFSTIKGEKSPKPEDEFKSEGKTKADVIKLLEESIAYGDSVVNGVTEESVNKEISFGRGKLALWKIILFGVDHITHHRGQIVVYLRLNGIKPPQYRSGLFG